MRDRLIASMVGLLVFAGAGQCQNALTDPPVTEVVQGNGQAPAPRIWISGEYLLWWIKDQPLPGPLVTVNSTAAPTLGTPGTQVIYGNEDQDMGSFSGFRFTLGTWLGDGSVGVEASGFLLPQRSQEFHFASDAAGNPRAGWVRFNNSLGGQPTQVSISSPLTPPGKAFQTGTILIRAESEFWGAEINGLLNLARGENYEFNLLGGFRHLNLREQMELQQSSVITTVGVGSTFRQRSEDFSTSDEFYGGQLGARLGLRRNRLTADLSAKVALGGTVQHVALQGISNPATASNFIYVNASNQGSRTSSVFSVVPEAQARIGYNLTSWLRATVGYDFVYWSNVVRPGNQINRSFTPGVPITAPPTITPLFNSSDFWAHGVSFGAELRW